MDKRTFNKIGIHFSWTMLFNIILKGKAIQIFFYKIKVKVNINIMRKLNF